MRKLSLLLPAAALLICGSTAVRAGDVKDNQQALSFKQTVTKTVGYEYLLFLPKGYEPKAEKKWPLLLFLHGSGERGSDVWLVSVHGPPKLLKPVVPPAKGETEEARQQREAAAKLLSENFIVVSPQCPAGACWDNETLLLLLDHITAAHKVDTGRVYLTGLSMGGFGTWSLGCRFPNRFAALVPICGGGERIDVLIGSRELKAALQSLGVWAFHGGKDGTVPPEESQRMVDTLKKAGVKDIQLTVYPEAGHDSWSASYANPRLYEWLLEHRRAPVAE
jgi:predicted peptidase